MKILMIHQDRDEMYGAVHSMLELLTQLSENHNIEPIVLTSKEGNVAKYCKEKGWKYYVTGQGNFMMGAGTKKKVWIRAILFPIFFLKYKLKNIRAIYLAEKYINFDEIDLIHTNTNVCDLGAILAERHNKPHFWHLREYGDLDYNRISFRKKYISYMNDHATLFFAISNSVREHWIKKGISKNKIVTVYNGVEPIEDIKVTIRNSDSIDEDKIKIVFSGSISESKGQYLLINSIANLSKEKRNKLEIDIIGDGPRDYVNSLKKIIKDKEINNVIHFLGYKSNIRNLLFNYDVGMMCSRAEGFGRVTIEYMMAGLCTIASNRGANKELIKDDSVGILFDYPNIEDLCNKIEWCIDHYEEAKKIGKNARKYACNNFTSIINANNIYINYEAVLGGKK